MSEDTEHNPLVDTETLVAAIDAAKQEGIPVDEAPSSPSVSETEPVETTVEEPRNEPVTLQASETVKTSKTPYATPASVPFNSHYLTITNVRFTDLESRNNDIGNEQGVRDATLSQADKEWVADSLESSESFFLDGQFDSRLDEPGSLWQPGVPFEGKNLRGGTPQLANKDPGLLSGDNAVLAVRSVMNMGTIGTHPYWHSGVVLTFKAPGDTDLLEFERRSVATKNKLGSSTVGLVYANDQVFHNIEACNFILSYVTSANMEKFSVSDLKAVMKITDVNRLAWAMATVIYPNGYPLRRPCFNNPRSCHHVEELLLNLNELEYTNGRALSDRQKAFIANPKLKRSVEEIQKYSEDFEAGLTKKLYVVNPRLSILFKVPTIQEYENSGYEWIESINTLADSSTNTPLRGSQRETYIKRAAEATKLRLYTHFVKEIILTETNQIVSDKDTINQIINDLSTALDDKENSVADKIIDAIREFIAEATFSLVAIPKYACKSCGELQTDHYDRHPNLIVIDPMKIFFTLAEQKRDRIAGQNPFTA